VWRKLDDEGLRNLYSLPNIVRAIKSRSMKWAGQVERMGEKKFIKSLIGKPEVKRTWLYIGDNIRIDFRETGWEHVGCIYVAQDTGQWRAFVNTKTNLSVP